MGTDKNQNLQRTDPELDELTFEDAVRELEEIVAKLESGHDSLEKSLNLFHRGVKLAGFCSTQLSKAEKTVKELSVTNEGEVTIKEFESDDDDNLPD